jgi:hypothetical protein
MAVAETQIRDLKGSYGLDGLFQKIEKITPKSKFLLKKKFLLN